MAARDPPPSLIFGRELVLEDDRTKGGQVNGMTS